MKNELDFSLDIAQLLGWHTPVLHDEDVVGVGSFSNVVLIKGWCALAQSAYLVQKAEQTLWCVAEMSELQCKKVHIEQTSPASFSSKFLFGRHKATADSGTLLKLAAEVTLSQLDTSDGIRPTL